MSKRIRKAISLEDKVSIIKAIDDSPNESKVDIAKHLGVAYSTLTTIYSKKEEIIKNFNDADASSTKRKRIQAGKFSDLEKALLIWFQGRRAAGIPIAGNLLQEKALSLASQMNITEEFKASSGWLQGFKERHGIVGRTICGESKAVDNVTVEDFKKQKLPLLIEGYEPRYVYNLDETGLFFELLPDKTLAEKCDPCHGGKKSKNRLSVMLCTNADGSDKMKLLVIGKYQNPRCFKHVKSKPTDYEANKKAWMTRVILEKWLKKWDAQLGREKRKVLLFMDSCAAHPPDPKLKNITVKFFPSNCTSELQPLDRGIIENTKGFYRKMLVQFILSEIDHAPRAALRPKITVLKAMEFLSAAWRKVLPRTIQRCFASAGFFVPPDDDEPEEAVTDEDYDEEWDLYVHHDDNVAVCGELDDADIIDAVRSASTEDLDSDEDLNSGAEEDEVPVPTTKEAHEAFEIWKRFVRSKDLGEGDVAVLDEAENVMFRIAYSKQKCQTKISDFFESLKK